MKHSMTNNLFHHVTETLRRPEKSTVSYRLIRQCSKAMWVLIAILITGCAAKEAAEPSLTPFEVEDKIGFVDAQSNIIISPRYDWSSSFREGLCAVKEGDKVGFINARGEVVVPIMYDTALNFSEGLAGVCINKECGYVDAQGNTLIPFTFSQVDYFRKHKSNLAIVRKGRAWGAIDQSGKIIFEIRYDDPPLIEDGFAIVTENGKKGLLNSSGEEVAPLKYDAIAYNVWGGRLLNEDLFSVNLGGKWGFLDTRGKVQVPFRYEQRSFFSGDYAIVQREGKTYRINKSGKETPYNAAPY